MAPFPLAASIGRRRVVLLTGPSGSGKSRLADRLHDAHGWPVVRLDNFYRDGDDPGLPRSAELGIVDWDDPRSWHAEAAVAALTSLIDTGTATCPIYDISTSRAIGHEDVTCPGDALIVAEGIFAPELIGPLRSAGLLHSAYVIAHPRWVTFGLRLARDLSERRKPPLVLLRRGVALLRAEPRIVADACARGAVRRSARAVEAEVCGQPAESSRS